VSTRPGVGARPSRRTTGLPAVLVPLATVAVLFLVVPVIGLLVRTPWRTLGDVLSRDASIEVAMSASANAIAWFSMIGLPNCSRVFA